MVCPPLEPNPGCATEREHPIAKSRSVASLDCTANCVVKIDRTYDSPLRELSRCAPHTGAFLKGRFAQSSPCLSSVLSVRCELCSRAKKSVPLSDLNENWYKGRFEHPKFNHHICLNC